MEPSTTTTYQMGLSAKWIRGIAEEIKHSKVGGKRLYPALRTRSIGLARAVYYILNTKRNKLPRRIRRCYRFSRRVPDSFGENEIKKKKRKREKKEKKPRQTFRLAVRFIIQLAGFFPRLLKREPSKTVKNKKRRLTRVSLYRVAEEESILSAHRTAPLARVFKVLFDKQARWTVARAALKRAAIKSVGVQTFASRSSSSSIVPRAHSQPHRFLSRSKKILTAFLNRWRWHRPKDETDKASWIRWLNPLIKPKRAFLSCAPFETTWGIFSFLCLSFSLCLPLSPFSIRSLFFQPLAPCLSPRVGSTRLHSLLAIRELSRRLSCQARERQTERERESNEGRIERNRTIKGCNGRGG